ncbi:hypothetical protein NQ317_014742 [Molorchus minor]|uniref:Uncharacterized protein n=1 Tax=Molorchus minor TaxID=1323400 RepID=A0ABQ9J5F2_9CUCU|nr:hypothetical protein NQ317_014742 [Molorchus minor]
MDLSRAKRILKLALEKQDVSISNNSEDKSNNLLNVALLHDVVILIIANMRLVERLRFLLHKLKSPWTFDGYRSVAVERNPPFGLQVLFM